MTVTLQREQELDPDEFVDLVRRSTAEERGPAPERAVLKRMIENSDLLVTARNATSLIGVARAITDFTFCTYIHDLAVDLDYQRQGIGRGLLARTHQEAGLSTTLILLAASNAEDFYEQLGLKRHESCWVVPGARA